MEHVINAKLRNQAFWKFIILFLVTIVIVITAVYFDYDVPDKENAMLREKIKNYENQVYSEQQFIIMADSVKTLIDTLSRSKGNYDYINSLIGEQLGKMTSIINAPGSTSIYMDINKKVLNTFLSFHNTKKLLVYDASQQISDLTDQLRQCQRNNENAQIPSQSR